MLELVVPGLMSSLQARAADANAPLRALAMLHARSQQEAVPAECVEDLVCRRHGLAKQADWPLAALTYEVDGGRAGSDYWLRADPVHVEVHRDHLILTEVPDITDSEAQTLCSALSAHFGDQLAPLPMHATRWYLRAATDPDITTTPLSRARGRAIEPLLPRGAGAARWHRLLNEAQMLLFHQPLNEARETRGLPTINSVWLWGGGILPPAPASAPAHADFFGSDFTARAVAKFSGVAVHPLPASWQPDIGPASLCLLDGLSQAAAGMDASAMEAALVQLDSGWIGPLMQTGKTFRVTDPDAGLALRWHPLNRWKFWRRPARVPLPTLTPPLEQPTGRHDTVDEFGNRY